MLVPSSYGSSGRSARGARGSTLVELLVALTLLGIGGTALIGGMRASVRSVASGLALTRAAASVESRFEMLRLDCMPSPGFAVHGPVRERWQIVGPVGSMLPSTEIVDSLSIMQSSGVVARAVRSIVRCAQ